VTENQYAARTLEVILILQYTNHGTAKNIKYRPTFENTQLHA